MTRRRWIADEVEGNRAALTGANAEHLARVLRARIGQEFDIAVEGRVRRGRVSAIEARRVEFELGEEVKAEALPELIVLLAVFKFDRMEWAIEKLTELGVARIVPVIARRTETHLASAAGKRAERWRRIAKEAAQQSRRAAVPEIEEPMPFAHAVAVEAATRILLAESGERSTLREALAGVSAPVALAVGPEGGWTADELRAFTAAGWRAASLGTTILRAETAAIAAAAIVISQSH